MRFGISATSWIFPKNLRTRLRPVNVCAVISPLFCRTVGTGTTLRKAAIHRDHPDRRRSPLPTRFGHPPTALCDRRKAEIVVISDVCPKSPVLFDSPAELARQTRAGADLGRPAAARTDAYLSSILAPTFSRAALIFSASSFGMPSLTGLGAASTRSLASLRLRPVAAQTSLITSIFLSPIAARTTVNSVFSSTGAAAAPPGAAATATAAAADTPHFSSSILASSAASSTVRLDRSVTIFCRSAISLRPIGSNQSRLRRALRRLALVGISRHNASDFRRGRVDDLGNLGRRRLDEADDLGPQLVERRQRSECLDAVLVERGLAHRPAQDHELLVGLG